MKQTTFEEFVDLAKGPVCACGKELGGLLTPVRLINVAEHSDYAFYSGSVEEASK